MTHRPTRAELEALSSAAVVEQVVEHHALMKVAGPILLERPPDAAAAAAVIQAFEAGLMPPWLTAYLLGCVRHSSGYEVARRILIAAPGAQAESYASVAMVHIGGQTVLEDLVELLANAPHWRSREGAAYGLRALGDRAAVEPLMKAVAGRFINRRCAEHVLQKIGTTRDDVLGMLHAEAEELRALAFDILSKALDRKPQPQAELVDRELAEAALEVIRSDTVVLGPITREELVARLAAYAASAGSS